MRKLFYIGLALLVIFEIMKVYLIMPMPGSQRMDSIELAYFLHNSRWIFRGIAVALTIAGSLAVFRDRKWIAAAALSVCLLVVYYFNFEMLAEKMFLQPQNLRFSNKAENMLTDSSIVIGVEFNGEAKAYPIRYLSYHHQVKDVVGGKPMIITYCNVCRTGRVFEPVVDGKPETFRLVGMDHFNAMFEDATTSSWWRQATGEAAVGPAKGKQLPEIESTQSRLKTWFQIHPDGKVMQPDITFRDSYDSTGRFEKGKSKGKLTRTDSISWRDKSWVVGISLNGESKAYDWFMLKERRIVNDVVGGEPIVLALASDDQSFVSYKRPLENIRFEIKNDTLMNGDERFNLAGRNLQSLHQRLQGVKSYQEFWHSWRTFHPDTKRFE